MSLWSIRLIGSLLLINWASGCAVPATPRVRGGQTRLVDAAWQRDFATVGVLMHERLDVNARGAHGESALEGAAWHGDAAAVDALLRAGAAASSAHGRALQFAAVRGNTAVVHRLLMAGADPDVRDGNGRSPLSLAALGGHTAVVELLLNAGAETELRSDTGMTALMQAAVYGHAAAAALLIRRGANVAAQRDDGSTPWTIAVERNDLRMMQLLRMAKPRASADADASWRGVRSAFTVQDKRPR